MEHERLFTKYSEEMDSSCPHAYYPRPTLKRDSYICLNGEWDFSVNKERVCSEYSEKILVPFAPESALSGIERTVGKDEFMHYRRTFTCPEGFIKDRVILHFGAVDQECEVWINGVAVGCSHSGYLPFSFDITDALTDGENTVTVTARDTLSHKYPYGKQKKKRGGMWYTPVSGIWQTVWLESVPERHIEKIKVTPSENDVKIEIIGGSEKKRLTLKESKEVYEFTNDSITIAPENPQLWTPETPYLYYFTLESGDDTVESYFAIRKIGISESGGHSRLTLNGKPYLFNGLLDQGYYPDGLFMPATIDGYIDDILLTKRLGFNMLRKHIKIEPEIFYYLCDLHGIAVFQDMVNNGSYSFIRDTALPTVGMQKIPDGHLNRDKETRRIFTKTMLSTCEHLYSHPSLVYYTIFNEGWGQFSADSAYLTLREKDDTRIIDTTSGWFRRKRSDVDSRHIYFKALSVKDKDSRPLVISEFGGYSYRCFGHLFGKKNYGYRLFDSREDFEREFLKLYRGEVAQLIREGACAFVYTQLSDVEDETNGLVTYDRRVVKVDEVKCKETMDNLWQNMS